ALERVAELLADRRGGSGVRNCRARLEVQLARDQLRDHVLGSGEHVLVGRLASRRLRHDCIRIAEPSGCRWFEHKTTVMSRKNDLGLIRILHSAKQPIRLAATNNFPCITYKISVPMRG